MPWQKIAQGRFERQIGENERFIKYIGDRGHSTGREHWSVTAGAVFRLTKSIEAEDLHSTCRNAWRSLRFQHPSIACTADNDKLTYTVPDLDDLKAWENESFSFHAPEVSKSDVIARYKPCPYAKIDILTSSSEVLIHQAHWRTDGVGALQLVDAFLQHLCSELVNPATISWGEEVDRLTLSIEEVLQLPLEPTSEIVEETQRCLATLALTRDTVGVSCQADSQVKPAGTCSTKRWLSKSTTSSLQQACHELGIDFLAAVHASCAEATYSAASPDRSVQPYTSTIRLALRPYLPKPSDNNGYAAAIYTGGYMIQVPASNSWLANAKTYQEAYGLGATPAFLQARRNYAVEVEKILSKAVQPPQPLPSEIDISSVEKPDLLVTADRAIQLDEWLHVASVSLIVETLTRQLYCFVLHYRGRLQLELVYNEAFYDRMTADELIGRIEESLLSGLGM